MIIDLVRPKTVDLEELFELRLEIALASGGCDVTKRVPITLGQTEVDFRIEAAAVIDQAIVYKHSGELHTAFWVSPKAKVFSGMTATLRIRWSD